VSIFYTGTQAIAHQPIGLDLSYRFRHSFIRRGRLGLAGFTPAYSTACIIKYTKFGIDKFSG